MTTPVPTSPERFVRGGPLALAPLRAGFHLASHVLGHSRLVCDARVLEILAWHSRPRRPADVAAHFGESERGIGFVLGHLIQAQLLVPEGFDAESRIRGAFGSRRAELPPVATSMALARAGMARWAAPLEGASETETAAFALTPRSRVRLSSYVASLAVRAGETIALHPLGARVHLEHPLWRLARAFREAATIASVAVRLRRPVEDVVAACRFLVLRRILWTSQAAERRAFVALAARLGVDEDGPSVRQWSDSHHQWTDTAIPYDWSDVRRMTAFGRVAVVGQCQINFVGAALQRLAQRHHVYLDLFGEPSPSPALASTAWSAVVLSLGDFTPGFHDAAARGDWRTAEACIPGLIAGMDERVSAIRRYTPAPLVVVSVGVPGLSGYADDSAEGHRRARLYAETNQRLCDALRGKDAVLFDESTAVVARPDRVILDDEYTGAAHHCAYNPRFWIPLTQWAGVGPSSAPSPPFPEGDPQAGASDQVAAGLFDLLRRRYEDAPVRAVVFDPDTLLWPGHIAEKPEAHESLQRSLGRPDYQFYSGANEALLALRARGVKLVCFSSLPAAVIRERWNVPGDSTAFVSAAQVDAIVTDASELAQVLGEQGIRSDECLLVRLGGSIAFPPPHRAFRGDRWSLKRYLLTSPELARAKGQSAAIPEQPRSPSPMPSAGSDEDVARILDAAIESHLRLAPGSARAADDLRRLGLDSLTALDLAHDLEAKLQIRFADTDLTVATLYRRATLLDAALRARAPQGTSAARSVSPGPLAGPLFACASVTEIFLQHAEAARHPWQLKMVRSTKANDYEYAGWGTLLERAAGYADLFAALGAKPGDVVTLMLPQGVALVAAYVAALLYDFVPSIVAAPSEKLSESAFAAWFGEVAARSGTSVVVCSPPHEALVRVCIASSPAPGIRVSSDSPLPTVRSGLPVGRTPGRPLLLQHSSGTTGLKKAVLLGERAVLAQVRHLAKALECDARDVVVSWAPLYHDMGLLACLLLPLLADLPLVMMSPFDWLRSPETLLREITRERGTLSWMPNFAFTYSAQRIGDEALAGMDLSSWRAVVNCSEPVTERAVDVFHRRFAQVGLRRSALSASFAMAETTFAVTQVPPGRGLLTVQVDAAAWRGEGIARGSADPAAERVVLVGSGQVIGGTELVIVGPRGELLPEGHAGEIRVRGDSLMNGYFGDPEATAGAVRDGWYSTGDLGVLLGAELYVTGRKKDLVIVAGHNVYPHDVEESVGAIAGMKPGRVVAFGVPDEALGTERLVLLAETDARADEAALSERVRAHVSSVFGVALYDVRFFGARTLHKSTSGKLSRARNRELYLEKSEPPATITESDA